MNDCGILVDAFPDWLSGGGIFAYIAELVPPWDDVLDPDVIDIEYFGNHSGNKAPSPLVQRTREHWELTTIEKTRLAVVISQHYFGKWGKLWNTLSLVYNPIENYSMTEVMTNDRTVIAYGKTHSRTDNLTHGRTYSNTRTPNTTETVTPNTTDTTTPNTTETITPNTTKGTADTLHAFNSSNAVPTTGTTETETGTHTTTRTGTETTTHTGTHTTTQTGTVQESGTDTNTDSGTQSTTEGGQDTNTRNYSLSRSGNVGVTTSQQMIESERQLWMWDFMRDVVFPDVDKLLTLAVY